MGVRNLSLSSIATGVKRSKFWDQSAAISNPAYVSLATYTPTGSSFTISGISQAYKHLELRMTFQTNSIADTTITVNSDLGLRTWSLDARTGTSSGYYGGSGTPSGTGLYVGEGSWSNSFPTVSLLRFPDYTNTNKLRSYFGTGGQRSSGAASVKWLVSGLFNTTSALTTITITAGASFSAGTTFALYGIKG